jgi:hypothetical protein
MSPCLHVYVFLHVSGIPQKEKGIHGKWQLPYFFCKRKKETANLRLFAANENGKRTFVFLDWQTINQSTIAVLANVPIYTCNKP